MKPPACHGLLVLDKPSGLTSRQVVDHAQPWFAAGTRLGHAGTLDPLATGVLVVCVGVATRLVEYVQRMEKTYHAVLRLGATSTTDDADGTIEAVAVEQPPDRAQIVACLQGFLGTIEQVPPAHSAAKVSGRRAYELARRGHEVSLEPRPVHITALDLLTYDYPHVELLVRCGKGTYIRALARDLGKRLGCGALVDQLRRTRIGLFDVASALSLDSDRATVYAAILPLSAAVAELPHVVLEQRDVERLRQGQRVSIPDSTLLEGSSSTAMDVAVFDSAETLVAVAVANPKERLLRPAKVLPPGA